MFVFGAVFSLQSLYKTQVRELGESIEEKNKEVEALQNDLQMLKDERSSLSPQLELAYAKAESEELARSIAEEQIADLEKEKTMLELEVKDLNARHSHEMSQVTREVSALIVLNDIKDSMNPWKSLATHLPTYFTDWL